MILINTLAQAADAGAKQPNPVMPLILMGLFFLAMWFLLIAPQRKKMKEHEKMMNALKPGDEIVTSGGIFGTIQQVRDDRLVVKISDTVRVEIAKGFISSKIGSDADKK
ncbi:MAG TPA: preprotein translocase subunit YajC [Opitutales bacterium]|nr:preprotein translocase subunit YajC [Opitutales bacterium]